MNNLNSVLIEGIITGIPKPCTNPDGDSGCRFTLDSKRSYRAPNNKEALITKTIKIDIIVYSGILVESCNKTAKKGGGARVVGALDMDTCSTGKCPRIVIIAEHIEFRPEFKREESKPERTSTRKKQ